MACRGRHRTPGSAGARGLLWPLQWLGDATPADREAAREVAPLGVILADVQFDSEQNHRHVHERLGAVSVIPAKRGKATWWIQSHRAKMRAAFPRRQLYRRRALVESVFSAVKRKLLARAPGRSLETQRLRALLVGVGLQSLPAQTVPGLRRTEPPSSKGMSTKPGSCW